MEILDDQLKLMFSPMFGALLIDGVVLNEKEKEMVGDYNAACALNLFPVNSFEAVSSKQ